jgi:hypothetical protein
MSYFATQALGIIFASLVVIFVFPLAVKLLLTVGPLAFILILIAVLLAMALK